MEAKFVVRYGATRFIGEFGCKGRENYARSTHVVLRTDRGVEIGEVNAVGNALRDQIGNDDAWFEEWARMGDRLEARGRLKAEWKTTETGRDAKFYGLTRAGRRQLESERANWERLAQAIALVLSTAQ